MSRFACVASCLLAALTALTAVGHGADVTWTGTVDCNWNVSGNWSTGRVPGTEPGDRALLSGRSVAPVVATLVEADNTCSVDLSDDALLEVTHSGLRCDEVVLGVMDGVGGGHLMLRGRGAGVMTVAGDLRVGHSGAAISASSVKLRTGQTDRWRRTLYWQRFGGFLWGCARDRCERFYRV